MKVCCHVYSFRDRTGQLKDYEIAMLRLSVMEWRRVNQGLMVLCSNFYFMDYARRTGFFDIYDDWVQIEVPGSVNQKIFWAAAKIYAYQKMPVGTVFIDIDAALHVDIDEFKQPGTVLICAHEDKAPGELHWLPASDTFVCPKWMRDQRPYKFSGYNMAIVCFLSEIVRDKYTDAAIGFMEGNPALPTENYSDWGLMVYAEQRIIWLLLESITGRATYVVPDFKAKPAPMTHLWQGKKFLDQSASARDELFRNMDSFIFAHYPDSHERSSISVHHLLAANGGH